MKLTSPETVDEALAKLDKIGACAVALFMVLLFVATPILYLVFR